MVSLRSQAALPMAASLSSATHFGEFRKDEQALIRSVRTGDLASLPTVTVDLGIHRYKDEGHQPIRQGQELKIAQVTAHDVQLKTSAWERAGDKLTLSLSQLFNDFSPHRADKGQSNTVHQPVYPSANQSVGQRVSVRG